MSATDHDTPLGTLAEFLDSFDEISDDVELVTPGDNDHGEDPTPRFKIMSERAAVWAMRKLAGKRALIEEHHQTAQAEIERIMHWQAAVNEPLLADCEFFEFLLAEWHATNIEADLGFNPLHGPVDAETWRKYKAKSRKLPNGEIAARISSGTFGVTDAENAIRFLDEIGRDDLVKRDPKISATLLDGAADTPDAGVKRTADGDYFVCVAEDVCATNEFAESIFQALYEGTPARALIDALPDELTNAQPWADRRIMLTVEQELGHDARVRTWVQIPDVHKTGIGTVTIRPKPVLS